MDVYMPGAKTHWPKKVEGFARTVFLISSSVFAVILGLVLIDKTNTISNSTEFLAIPIVATWFTSFAIWMVFLIANSRVGGYFKSKTASKPKHKELGLLFIFLGIISLVGVGYFGAQPASDPIARIFAPISLFGVLIVLPAGLILIGGRVLKIITMIVFGFIILFFVIYLFILRPHKTTGGSMTPNFVSGEYVLSEHVTYYFNSPKRGDVIVFSPPYDKSQEFFARIVGIPGEYISIRKGHVYINNKILDEPYVDKNILTESGPKIGDSNTLIPAENYVVMGDNRPHSNDSRYYGFVEKGSIKGRFFYIYWPKDKTGFIKNPFIDIELENSIIN